VFVDNANKVSVHSSEPQRTVYSIPVLPVTRPAVQQAIWRVAAELDALVLGENGQLIWMPGEQEWSEPALRGGRAQIKRGENDAL
jgi:hypothetical protein